uniref:Membrane insertase YidC/Oxa/ALB C-terminal domain-containing protein n=1 Tax=Mucochytrium quahogii TaxID=96639 RepID=A0A7S2RLY3_9STRA|mmetsp:Transcript_10582/g.17276  ORF Transcript_10582/g.17276 Transcript_10582/m.17276 type:complete len:373 (+) Transcript_10582:151-1269(+)
MIVNSISRFTRNGCLKNGTISQIRCFARLVAPSERIVMWTGGRFGKGEWRKHNVRVFGSILTNAVPFSTSQRSDTTLESAIDALDVPPVTDKDLGIVASAVGGSTNYSPMALIQSGILGVHSILGGPWWSTFALCTVAFRTCLIPVTIMQMKTMSAIFGGPVGYHMHNLNALYSKEVKSCKPHENSKKVKLTKLYFSGIRKIFKKYKVNPLKIMAVPILQSIVLITYVFSTRGLIENGLLDLSNEGMLWFTNLSTRDSTLILPLIAVATTYTSLEFSLTQPTRKDLDGNIIPNEPSSLETLRNVLQYLMVFGLPFISQLPSGVFMYWIPSSLFALGQTIVFRSIQVRKAIGLPIPRALEKEPEYLVNKPKKS